MTTYETVWTCIGGLILVVVAMAMLPRLGETLAVRRIAREVPDSPAALAEVAEVAEPESYEPLHLDPRWRSLNPANRAVQR